MISIVPYAPRVYEMNRIYGEMTYHGFLYSLMNELCRTLQKRSYLLIDHLVQEPSRACLCYLVLLVDCRQFRIIR